MSVGSFEHRQHRHLAAEAFGEALAAQVERDVADLLVDADADLAAHLLELGAGDPAGVDFILADMQERAELLRNVGAGIHRDHRDARGDGLLDRRAERRGVGDRDDQAGGLLVDGRVDELAHRDHVEGFGRAVIDLHLHVLAGGGDAVLDHRPERIVGLAVGDDDDRGHSAGQRPAGAASGDVVDGLLRQERPVTKDFMVFSSRRWVSWSVQRRRLRCLVNSAAFKVPRH